MMIMLLIFDDLLLNIIEVTLGIFWELGISEGISKLHKEWLGKRVEKSTFSLRSDVAI